MYLRYPLLSLLIAGLSGSSHLYLQPLVVGPVVFVEQLVSAAFVERLAFAVEVAFVEQLVSVAFVVLLVHFVTAVRSLVWFGHFEHLFD